MNSCNNKGCTWKKLQAMGSRMIWSLMAYLEVILPEVASRLGTIRLSIIIVWYNELKQVHQLLEGVEKKTRTIVVSYGNRINQLCSWKIRIIIFPFLWNVSEYYNCSQDVFKNTVTWGFPKIIFSASCFQYCNSDDVNDPLPLSKAI